MQKSDCFETAIATHGDDIEFLAAYEKPGQLELRFWAVASALGHPCVEGMADRELSSMLETTRANFSKYLTNVERINGLPPGLGQKTMAARRAYVSSHTEGDNKARTVARSTWSSCLVYSFIALKQSG